MKVAFIGLGNMGASLAKAIAKEVVAKDLLLINRSPQKSAKSLSASMGEQRLILKKLLKRRRSFFFRGQTLPDLSSPRRVPNCPISTLQSLAGVHGCRPGARKNGWCDPE